LPCSVITKAGPIRFRCTSSRTALHHFLRAKRKEAIAAIAGLIFADPTDARAVYALQRLIHPYFDACDFVQKTLEAGENADQTIEETYGNGAESQD
jgi:hypothetical protein